MKEHLWERDTQDGFENDKDAYCCEHSTVVDQATHMQMYAGSSPASVNHCEELIKALT